MCGIAGFLDRSLRMSAEALSDITGRMTDSIRHRGPDDSGLWVDAASGTALGHRRLSILDLSAEGHQPMQSASGSFVIVFNGEIYNFQDIRADLEGLGCRFRGHSDTEVMLAAFEQWGVRSSVDRFNGMFSFAVWDRRERTLHLCRDRMGKKPLFYGWAGRTLLFASELKAFHQHPDFRPEIDRDVLALYLRHGYIPAPYSIYRGVLKLPAGSILAIIESDAGACREPERYWSVAAAAGRSLAAPIADEEEAFRELGRLLEDAVRIRMISDVPLGAFLSGGIDSSLVVAVMQSISSIPVRTFSIGFREAGFDEAPHAREIARHLGCSHTELYVTPGEAQTVVPDLCHYFDEPFSDSSMIPTLLVSKLTRQSVTVGLSGDGGDELFGGYEAYRACLPFFARNRQWPLPLRRMVSRTLAAMPASLLDAALGAGGIRDASHRIHRAATIMAHDSPGLAYRDMMGCWPYPERVAIGGKEPNSPFGNDVYHRLTEDDVARMMLIDAATYLPDDILVKVDRASMAVSLESRCPLLDYRLFEFAWRLPMRLKRRDGAGKWILKQQAYKLIPRELLDRPKSGFAVPVSAWLRGPLRQWCEDLLDEARLRREGWLNPAPVRAVWQAHLSGQVDHGRKLWNILMFQAWLDRYHSRPVSEYASSVALVS